MASRLTLYFERISLLSCTVKRMGCTNIGNSDGALVEVSL